MKPIKILPVLLSIFLFQQLSFAQKNKPEAFVFLNIPNITKTSDTTDVFKNSIGGSLNIRFYISKNFVSTTTVSYFNSYYIPLQKRIGNQLFVKSGVIFKDNIIGSMVSQIVGSDSSNTVTTFSKIDFGLAIKSNKIITEQKNSFVYSFGYGISKALSQRLLLNIIFGWTSVQGNPNRKCNFCMDLEVGVGVKL